MKIITLLIFFSLTEFINAQSKTDTIKVITKYISGGTGDKIHINKYKVLKILNGSLTNDTIVVGFYGYKSYDDAPDTALLTILPYTGPSKVKDYYSFPDYNAKKGIEKVKISSITFDYWEGCETGKGACNPLFLNRNKNEKWYLLMPCRGTQTSVTLTSSNKNKPIQNLNITHAECPPMFELTNLDDGKYYLNMMACGLGGTIEMNIVTDD
jgi:hypothetical protein